LKYGSVCSGIEAATVAWHDLGWEPQWFSEIAKFPSAVLSHHYPKVPNLGDMSKFKEWKNEKPIDLLVGGTPCQSFSVAGLRKGLEDPRGNLMLTYLAMADRFKPKWLVWENVPGVLSSNRGRDFGTFLGSLGEIGYGWAYRVLNSEYFGVPQRRRRVFVVGCLAGWDSAGEVLFESESLSGHPAPCQKPQENGADTCYTSSSFGAYREGVGTVRASGGDLGGGSETLAVTHRQWPSDVAATLNVQYADKRGLEDQHIYNGASHFVETLSRVRRLTPVECERLQGFPDDYTQIPYGTRTADNCPVGPRYEALGNSMAVPVMRWIGERINEKEGDIIKQA